MGKWFNSANYSNIGVVTSFLVEEHFRIFFYYWRRLRAHVNAKI